MKSTLLRVITIGLCSICYSANAHWLLVEDESSLSFVSTKNQHISEVQKFQKLTGEFSPEGKLKVEIDLASIDSGIGIRDTRMREKLFMVDSFPKAVITAQLTDDVLALPKGSSTHIKIPAELTIMKTTKTIMVAVQVTRKADDGIVATSTQPILISASDFGLQPGIEVLQKLAGLSGINLSVPVNFNLIFVAH